ncbi:MAG: tetratricopeptide repeat protein [Saprospiraceae bacterium]|nr:tetratricopeptide repeat protein [Pyrinomonadaceae bacterium]
MSRKNHIAKSIFASLLLFSMSFQSVPVYANDLVGSDDLAGGASVFVFRESRKKPQERAGGSVSGGGGGGRVRSYRDKVNAQIAASRKKKAATAKAKQAQLAAARRKERVAKLKLSNTFAAKGEDLMEKGDAAGAMTAFRESIKLNAKNTDAISGLSDALTAKGIEISGADYNEAAVGYFTEAVKLNPRNEIAYAKLGEIHDARDRNELALTNYEKALAIDPALSALYMPIGLAYVQAGDVAKADIYLTKAETAGADGAEARFARGVLLYKQNKNAEALAVFDKIAAAEPQSSAAQYQRAVILDRLGQNGQSVDAYKKTLQIDPNYSMAWFDMGVIHYNKGEYNEAVNAYQQVLKTDNANYKAHKNLASTFRQLERYPEANASYKLAEPGYKNDPDLYSEWGFCLGKTAEWDKSVAKLETARTISPTAVDDTNVGWGYYNSAQADKQAKNDAAAKAKLEKSKMSLQSAVQKDPNLDAAHLNLGSTYNGLGEHDSAVKSLDQANKLHGDWAIAINQLGLAYRGLNNLTAALQQFNRVVSLDGNSVNGLFNLGSTQYASGDKKGAKKTQDKLKKVNPDLANQLGNIIAGKLIEAGTNELKKKVKIPGIPF